MHSPSEPRRFRAPRRRPVGALDGPRPHGARIDLFRRAYRAARLPTLRGDARRMSRPGSAIATAVTPSTRVSGNTTSMSSLADRLRLGRRLRGPD